MGEQDVERVTTGPIPLFYKYFKPLYFCSQLYSPFSTFFNTFSLLLETSSFGQTTLDL